LVGKYIYNKQDSKEDIIEFIQVFSKVIGHHKTYTVDVLNYLKKNELDNIEFVKILLPKLL
jgi:lysine-N-methylase